MIGISAFQDWCLVFSVYMYGYNMGALVVKAGSSGQGLPYRWFWYGDKGAFWQTQWVTIQATRNLVVSRAISLRSIHLHTSRYSDIVRLYNPVHGMIDEGRVL